MKIRIEYATQVRAAIGIPFEDIEFDRPTHLLELLDRITKDRESKIRAMLLSDEGELRSGVLAFVNDEPVDQPRDWSLRDGDRISLMTLVSGG